jgi:hypothetical protein
MGDVDLTDAPERLLARMFLTMMLGPTTPQYLPQLELPHVPPLVVGLLVP